MRIVLSPHQISKKKKGFCTERGCSNTRCDGKNICAKHVHRKRKEKDLCAYTFHSLKCNARRRGKVFTITLDYFRGWCHGSNYLILKGRTAEEYSIDRDNPDLGYEPGNLKLMKVGMNSRKKYVDYYNKMQANEGEEKAPW